MDINELLKGKDCECGRRHDCPIDLVCIESGAEERLKDVFPDDKNILIVADENTFAADGEAVIRALAGRNAKRIIFPGSEILVPDEKAIAAVEDALGDATAIVGIGSGVIQDLCKYVSHDRRIPYAIVATATSMDGYASDGAAMILGGMKVTVKAGLPRAILADPAVLAAAPIDMIRAGYGDIIGKFSALNDWKLSSCVKGEYFCQWIYDLIMDQLKRTMSLADALMKRDPEAVGALMEAIVIVGIAMSFAGSSRPASGSEHHLSHFFEITGILQGRPYFPHGIDVGYSTVITAAIREKLLAAPFPERRFRLPDSELDAGLLRVYGSSARGCRELQDKVGNYAADRTQTYLSREDEIRAILSEVPAAERIKEILAAADYDIKEFYDMYGEDRIRDAVKWAKDLKDRYTVLWVNYDLYDGEL